MCHFKVCSHQGDIRLCVCAKLGLSKLNKYKLNCRTTIVENIFTKLHAKLAFDLDIVLVESLNKSALTNSLIN